MKWIGNMPHIARLARVPYLEMMRRVYDKLHEMGYDDMNSTYSVVFQFIGEGSRLTEIAKRANLSKQNVKYLVEQLVNLGYVVRIEDPNDRRAALLKLTKKGISFRDTAYQVIAEVEFEWAQSIGEEKMIKLKKLLTELNEAITTDK